MKKLIFISAITILFAHCTVAENNKNFNSEDKTTSIQHIGKAQFISKVFNYTQNTKEVKYLGSKPCIVDFYAEWCGPCKRLSPILEELAGEYKGKIIIYKIDSDKEKQLSGELGIQALPTLIFFPMKGKPYMSQGLMSKDELKKIIDKELLKNK